MNESQLDIRKILLYAVAIPVGFLFVLWAVAHIMKLLGCSQDTSALGSAVAKIAFACSCLYFFVRLY